jgi:hypothetical protein
MRLPTTCLVAALALLAAPTTEAARHVEGYAVDELTLPRSAAEANELAYDLDGDGAAENQFGDVLVVLRESFELDLPAQNAEAVATGFNVDLIELVSRDPGFVNDPAAQASWYVGQSTAAAPLFDGSDTFSYADGFPPAHFTAPLAAGAFASADPVTSPIPTTLILRFRVGSIYTELALVGARLAFVRTAPQLVQGRVNGAIRASDMEDVFVPVLALSFNEDVQADPTSPRSMALLGVFDTDPTDGTISTSEVAEHPLITSILAPDLDLFTDDGYDPDPEAPNPDAMSFGFAFTAIESTVRFPRVFLDGFEP